MQISFLLTIKFFDLIKKHGLPLVRLLFTPVWFCGEIVFQKE